jgi:hypothetical protein
MKVFQIFSIQIKLLTKHYEPVKKDFTSEVESIGKLLGSLETNGISGTTVKELINVVCKLLTFIFAHENKCKIFI